MLEVIARSFYADKDTLTPFWAALGGAAINLTMSIVLSGVLNIAPGQTGDQGNVGGLALANSLGVAFEVITLLIILRRRWSGIQESAIARTLAKTLAASLVMGLAVVLINTGWTMLGLTEHGKLWTIIQVGVEVGVGGLAFVITAWVLKMGELRAILDIALRRRQIAEVTV